MELVRNLVLERDCVLTILTALDHRQGEIQKNLDSCVELKLARQADYWIGELARVDHARRQISGAREVLA